jgi:hypothetical protein
MGGAATVCVVSGETHNSYLANNDAMKAIANNAKILSADPTSRVELAKALFTNESKAVAYSHRTDTPGLAPKWSGLNLIDLDRQRIWWCQGLLSLPVLLVWNGMKNLIANEPNVVELARQGMLRLVSDRTQLNALRSQDGSFIADHLPVVDEQRLLSLNDEDVFCFVVSAPGWEYRDFEGNTRAMYEAIRAEYTLTESEEQRWRDYLAEHS